MRYTYYATYNSGPLYTRCRKWCDENAANGTHVAPITAEKFCRRVFNRIKKLDPAEPIENAFPMNFTIGERVGGLRAESHMESIIGIAVEYFEMMTTIETAARTLAGHDTDVADPFAL